jgi:hypothetical protein
LSHFLFCSEVCQKFKQVELANMRNVDDIFAEFCETTPSTTDVPVPPTNLLGIDELLENVCSYLQNSLFLFSLFI